MAKKFDCTIAVVLHEPAAIAASEKLLPETEVKVCGEERQMWFYNTDFAIGRRGSCYTLNAGFEGRTHGARSVCFAFLSLNLDALDRVMEVAENDLELEAAGIASAVMIAEQEAIDAEPSDDLQAAE